MGKKKKGGKNKRCLHIGISQCPETESSLLQFQLSILCHDKVEEIRKRTEKRNGTDEEGFIASRSSISLHVHRGPPTLPLSLYEQATETCFSTGRPHLPPPLFSNPGSTGPLLLPQRPRYFVVVSSSMPPFFVSCSPFVSFFDSLSLSLTPILSSQFHLAAFPSYIFFYFVFRLILQFLRILFILPE